MLSTPLKICSILLFPLHLSARRNMFLVCSVASVFKERINMAKKENTWTMIYHWLPLTTPPIWGHLNVHVSSSNRVCGVATTSFLTPTLFFSIFKSHPYPEQHEKNYNALFTGQYIVTVQLTLAVDLWIGLLGIIHLTTVCLRGQQIRESAPSWKQSITTVSITVLKSEFLLLISSYHVTALHVEQLPLYRLWELLLSLFHSRVCESWQNCVCFQPGI